MSIYHVIDGFETQLTLKRILPGMYEIIADNISNERAPNIAYSIIPGKSGVLRDYHSALFQKSNATMSTAARSLGVNFRGRMIYGKNVIDIQYALLNLRLIGIGKGMSL